MTRERLLRRGLRLEYATLGWNVVGTVVVVAAAVAARSVALAGFGLDSLIEIFASAIVVWQLTGAHRDRERPALRLIGRAFVALALYILAQTAYTLLTRGRPLPSPGGIAWLAATLVAMLLLSYGKRVTGVPRATAARAAPTRSPGTRSPSTVPEPTISATRGGAG